MNIPIYKLNFQKHIISTSSSDIRCIAKPLEQQGILFFSYSKVCEDSSTISLSTHPEIDEQFINRKLYSKIFFGNIDDYIPCNAFWDDLGCQEFLQLTEGFGLQKGLVMVKKLKDACEFFYFSSQKNINFSNNFYLNNMDRIEQFVLHFKDVAKSILDQANQQKILFPQTGDESVLVSSEWKKSNLLIGGSSTELSKNFDFNIACLTKREQECTRFLKDGLSIKEIAQKMQISPRTAEKHLNQIKLKLNCASKSKLLIKLLAEI